MQVRADLWAAVLTETDVMTRVSRATQRHRWILRAWIEQGAAWPDDSASRSSSTSDHWAFRRPIRPALPAVRAPAWPRNPLDRFVLAGLRGRGLSPSPPADDGNSSSSWF